MSQISVSVSRHSVVQAESTLQLRLVGVLGAIERLLGRIGAAFEPAEIQFVHARATGHLGAQIGRHHIRL